MYARTKFKSYALKRFIQILVTIIIVAIFTFILIQSTPGDIAWVLAGEQASEEYLEHIRQLYGLDKPLYEQLLIYLAKLVRGDLGYSYTLMRPVTSIIIERIPATILLVGTAIILSALVGTYLGIYSARKHGSKIDKAITFISSLMYSTPVPWSGLIVILTFALGLRIFPTSGMTSVRVAEGIIPNILDILHHMVLPTLVMSSWYLPPFVRVARASILEVSHEDFIRTAKAIGFKEKTIFLKFAFKNAMLPTITLAGMQLGVIFSGAIITESMFLWPGLGTLLVEGINGRDYPLIMGVFIFTAIGTLLASLVVDIIYAYIDPRVTLA